MAEGSRTGRVSGLDSFLNWLYPERRLAARYKGRLIYLNKPSQFFKVILTEDEPENQV
jgi:hypothetical protein